MSVIHFLAEVLFKIVTTAVAVFAMYSAPMATPQKVVLLPWEMPGAEKTAATTLPKPAPTITITPEVNATSSVAVKPSVATTTPVKPKPAPQTPLPNTGSVPIIPVNPLTPAPVPLASGDLNIKTREALVNVLCVTAVGGYLKPISGSGIIIDPRGIVLTNAHIGQFFLLRDYPFTDNIQCVLRTGSPASPVYTAKLLYFPKSWLNANATKIVQESPSGTGEHDFSLLLITGRTNPTASLPASFPFVEPYIGSDIEVGDSVLLAGYPAGFLQGATIATSLYIASAMATIGEIFTFVEGGGSDLISTPGTILSQKGSSGGAVVRADTGKLLGLIVTATVADTTAKRDLRAITLRHINRSMIAETDQSLTSYLSGNLQEKADAFNLNVVPSLSKMLTDVLNK